MKITHITTLCYIVHSVSGFWDYGTTTERPWWRWDEWTARTSRFRWQRSETDWLRLFVPWWDWYELEFRRRLYVVAGVSYGMINLSTAAILNRRTVVTAANFLEPYLNDPLNIRIWALGRTGQHNTPYRYRAWRITRLVPRSTNPEHQHGPWAYHSPRDDIVIIHTRDQMYLYPMIPKTYAYAMRCFLLWSNTLSTLVWFAGCGYEYHAHVRENYKIFFHITSRKNLRTCSNFIPKMWGKFICFINDLKFPCIQNGGPLFDYEWITGVGCFEIRYNDESYLVFTDMRYYMNHIYNYAHIRPGEYYEYAYPQWSVYTNFFTDLVMWHGTGNNPTIPVHAVRDDMYPLGKK